MYELLYDTSDLALQYLLSEAVISLAETNSPGLSPAPPLTEI
jgi:hypothetical protein